MAKSSENTQRRDGRGRHGNHVKGSRHPRWNKGRIISSHGYVKIRVGKSHPMADPNGYAYEHDMVMVTTIGRYLSRGEVVHHKRQDAKQDNRIEKLELNVRREHSRRHAAGNTNHKKQSRGPHGQFVGVSK